MTHSIYGGDSEGYLRGIAEQAKVAREALIAEARAFWLETGIPTKQDEIAYIEEVAQICAIGHFRQIKMAKAAGLIKSATRLKQRINT